jgi:hypothetical protein
MSFRRSVARALSACILSAAAAIAQTGDRNPVDIKARVLDLLFPLDVTSKPYFLKLVLRFGDSGTQLAVVIYPGGESELVRYELADMNSNDLSLLVSKMVAQNPNVQDREIAAKVKVKMTRSPVDHKALSRALEDLKTLRMSPFLKTRIAVDEYSQYDYWFDSGQESVHYTITGPFKGDPQDRLVQWMIKFKARRVAAVSVR